MPTTTTRSTRVVAMGECMVELARGSDGRYGLSFGGDTFNTAVYLARAGVDVAYATLLGDDPYSDGIVALADMEGVDTALIGRREGRSAGLYLIETSGTGERTFHYWRDRSPARELLEPSPDADRVAAALAEAGHIYLSGITLSLYSAAALDRLAVVLADARRRGVRVVMDGNYRPRGWGGDRDRARAVFERFWRLADVALPSLEDEALLWGDADGRASIARLARLGIGEIVVKCGPAGALFATADGIVEVPVPATVAAVDTSAAGDSFNAAWLAARLTGVEPREAVLAGHRLAGVVVQHRGAVVPREATAPALAGLATRSRPLRSG